MQTFLENTELHFEMTVKNAEKWPDSWNEKLEKTRRYEAPSTNEEAIETAKNIIEDFNSSLRRGEPARILINVQRVETKVIDLINQNPYEGINEDCLVECVSCDKKVDMESAAEDSDSNYFCSECYEVLAPVMKAEYNELVEKGEIEKPDNA
jgi:hypothetical protein